ncbi:MAG: hypothetical protein COV34_01920 [Candidatus Zambryskibacteria bacterium CG10_big_fil_rev_8_21_14_0_10_42_12]|uniref:ATP synthase subunit a n=1 Tax=Candidatus Zambryskibacteria bacterium CG10_big_fil_rev_8_21_14_0_10_42_12 TaxID=1975115 RepID=A0A2H0QVN7_9BACT|nr:MAG: hypothetical protein COV34_01920 [Candidatus Zambryskibacteria bacterium CG10_big_fil_rev_8_21_14_0_10_42_12]
MGFLQIGGDIPKVEPDIIFTVFSFPISNTFLGITLVLLMVLSFSYFVVRKFSITPRNHTQTVVEMVYVGMEDLLEQVAGRRDVAVFLAPVILGMFVFIGVANLLSLIPIFNTVTYDGVAIFRTPTADFNTTFAMALVMILFIQMQSIVKGGFFQYLGKFFQFHEVYKGFKKSMGDGFMAIINFLIGLLDIISEGARVVSLSLRLFGNIYAGEVLVVILLGAFAYALPSVWISLSILFGVVQAVVFGALSAAYYSISMPPPDGEAAS